MPVLLKWILYSLWSTPLEASANKSFSPGDVLFMGANHQGLGPMQDGDNIDVKVEGVGRFSLGVSDSLKRRWPKRVDESTAQDIR